MPKTASAHQVQKQYRILFNEVIENKEPLVILNNNNPEVVIIDIQTYQDLIDANEKLEQEAAQKAITGYKKEKKQNKLKKLNSLAELM